MEKENLKAMLKEMFKSGEIEIRVSTERDYESNLIVTKVMIDNEEVCRQEDWLRIR